MKEISLYIMSFFYILAGIMHFLKPRFYLQIMPPYIPWHKTIVFLSGVAEILLGVFLLLPLYSKQAAWGVVVLLILIFPAHIHHLRSNPPGSKIPNWALYLRMPLQGVLIYWAWWHTW